MVLGEVLLWSAMACLVLQVPAAFLKKDTFRPLYRLSAFLATSVVALLTYYFVAGEFNYHYVYTHIGTTTPLVYRLSSVWAGQEGTFLLWAWVGHRRLAHIREAGHPRPLHPGQPGPGQPLRCLLPLPGLHHAPLCHHILRHGRIRP
ncbi:MAG: hypothetical protein GXO65_03870 [Euryarchaeota archaeon]|nr:hypothetical protein [Euryarchaeota archaeon]